MRTLNANLTAAQKSPSATPYPQIKVYDKIAGVTRLTWTRFYSGAEPDDFHDCCMPSDGSLIRIRRDASANVQYSRVTSPGSGSTYSSWTDLGDDCGDVACCASGVNVWIFYVNTSDGHLYRKDSTDSGATFGAWQDMGDIGGDGDTRIAAAAKSTTEAIVLYTGKNGSEENVVEYDSGEDSSGSVYSSWQRFTTFTAPYSFTLTRFNIKLWKSGAGAGTVTASIRATDANGRPTGADLTSATYDSGSLGGQPGAMIQFDVSDYDLTAGVKYAIVLRAAAGSTGNTCNWQLDSNDGYSGGNGGYSSNGGSTWVDELTYDYMFECFGYVKDAVFRRRLSGGSWEAAAYWTNALASTTGVACAYAGDWNVLVTGTEPATLDPGVWTCLLGDGFGAASDTWTSLAEHTIAAVASNVVFKAPTLDKPDVFRAFFVEALVAPGVEAYSRPVWTHSVQAGTWIQNALREPVPFNLSSTCGLALCSSTSHAWLTRPDGVWRASVVAASVDLTTDVVQVKAEASPRAGELTVVLRNDDGRYNTLGSGTYEAIKLGSELTFSPGYVDAGGTVRVSDGPRYWITGWDRVRDAGTCTCVIHAVDGWGLLRRWRARRQFSWAAGELNIFNLLRFVHARAGLELSSWGTLSTEMTGHKPAFTISPGERGDTAIERLLRKTHEVSLFRSYTGYVKQPQAGDSSDYTYGTDHAVLQASHGQQIKPLNRAQVTGGIDAGVFTEDFDWPELELVGDIIGQASDVYLDSATKAHRQGDALLRHADIEGLTGRITVPLNCGQELYDVVTVTDSLCGLSAATRRVLGLNHLHDSRKGLYHLRIALGDV